MLEHPCPTCDTMIDVNLDVCPHCGTPRRRTPRVTPRQRVVATRNAFLCGVAGGIVLMAYLWAAGAASPDVVWTAGLGGICAGLVLAAISHLIVRR